MSGILVGTAALIIVLSVFNGLEGLVKGFYQSFDPDLKASLVKGKYYTISQEELDEIQGVSGIKSFAEVLEERVLFTFRDKEHIASLKGVSENFNEVSNVREKIISGSYFSSDSKIPRAVIGAGVSYYLAYGHNDFESGISVFVPKKQTGTDFRTAFATKTFYPCGVFSVEPEFDKKFALAPIHFVRDLLGRERVISALEFNLNEEADELKIKKQLQSILGDRFKIQNRDEQQEILFKVMKSENFFTFLVFALILGISTFTIMGSLTMLMIDKKENLATLWAMGTDIKTLQNIFFKEGMIIGLVGAILGLTIGVLLIWAQSSFGLISLAPGYAIEAYPVELKFKDIITVSFTVMVLCSLASWLTSKRLSLKLIRSTL